MLPLANKHGPGLRYRDAHRQSHLKISGAWKRNINHTHPFPLFLETAMKTVKKCLNLRDGGTRNDHKKPNTQIKEVIAALRPVVAGNRNPLQKVPRRGCKRLVPGGTQPSPGERETRSIFLSISGEDATQLRMNLCIFTIGMLSSRGT